MSTLREKDLASTTRQAMNSLAERCDWILCHLDVDSIDPLTMPAVNFPAPNGLRFEEIKSIIAAAQNTRKLELFELAGYNPTFDPNRACAKNLAQLASEIFERER